MDSDTQAKMERLRSTAQRGAQIRDWLKHPGWTVFQDWAHKYTLRDHDTWLHEPDAAAAEHHRQDARWFFKLKDFLKKMITEGDVAKRAVDQIVNEEIQ